MAFYTFVREWTQLSRDMVREYEEIRTLRMKHFEKNSKDYLPSDESLSVALDNLSIKKQFDSVESLISAFDDELLSLTDRLHVKNMYMNKSIVAMIGKFEKILDDEFKLFVELLIPIFFNLREVENTYASELTDNVKVFVNNPKKVITKDFMDHFENR